MLGKMEMRAPPGGRPRDGRHCDLCGCSQPAVRCDKCGCQIFCLSCDDMYHRHPKRRFHLRKAVDPIPSIPQARPVLPVKVSHLNATNPGDPSKMPLPPPRKKKSSLFGSFRKPSPSSDNSPPLPKKEYSWSDRLGSIKKFMSNRPLPPLPTSDDNDTEPQPTTNGQSPRGDLSFIHKRSEERPPQLPQRSPRSPEFPGVNQEKENRIPSFPPHMPPQIRNGSLEPNSNHMNQNREFPSHEENQWNNRINNQNGPQAFGTLNRQTLQRGFMPPGPPGYPGGMHQSSSASDLHNLNNAEGMPPAGPVPPHYPHYPMNPHMPPHYPYPMYPQYPNYPQYFGNSFANLSNPPTSEGDLSDSESASRHSSRKHHQFRKRAKRSQSVMMDRMAYPGQFFPFGPYPGYGPWGAPMPMEEPPSPASSVRSLNRTGRTRRRKKMTSEDDDEELSETSSPMSRPKSSSSDPKEQPRAPLATQTTSSEYESDENIEDRRNKINTIRRQSEPVRYPSPPIESKRVAKLKKSSSKQSDSDTQESLDARNERRPSDSATDQQPPIRQSPIKQQQAVRQSPISQSPVPQSPVRQSPVHQSPVLQQQSAQQALVQQQPSTSTSSVSPDSWECKHCTFINPLSNRICQVCCKTFSPSRTETPMSAHSRPSSSAASNRKGSVGSEQGCSSPEKALENEDSRRDRQDMASLNSALDEAEKQISKGLEELMKLKDDIDANISKEKSKTSENEQKSESEENSKPTYKSSGRMRTSILDKLNLNKPSSSNASVSTSTETQTGANNWASDKIIEARRHSNSSTASETYNSPLAQSPDLERGSLGSKQKRDSSCQTQQDSIAEYLEKRKAAEEAYLGRPINNFGFGYGDRMDMVTSPVPSMYDRFFGGGYGMMQRSHSRASLFTGRMNDFGPMDYGPGFGYGPAPMYRSVSRGSLTGDYPDGRLSDWRKPDFYLSMEELVERRRQDNIRAQGLELVRMIREAEQQGFNADDIQVALTHCGKQNPLEWLQENWRNMVDSVVTLSTNYGNDKKENDIGLLSENEARDALRLHKGNIWAAVTECVEGRQRKYLELSARGEFSRQDIVDALTSSEGDVEMAYAKLTKSTGKPFLMRIWGQGEGAQNQDGAQPLPEDFNDGPRRYLKDETFNSDDLSDALWSEDGDGVNWDDDEDYEEERGDIEDLQTCHEDLQTSPQEMRTPESEKSDYCDAFAADDRNASSPSDDVFFVIPEPKPEKKKGFLSKLAALRRDSKEQPETTTNNKKDEAALEQTVQPKEDSVSQKSSSSSEQPKSNGALNALKNTFSAIKDSVTGGTKNDKKVPCSQPERRTIIVKGQLDHESLSTDSKDNVKLTSIKPVEDTPITLKTDSEPKGQIRQAEIALSKGQFKTDKDDSDKLANINQNETNQAHIDKSSLENVPKQVDSKSKAENKKPQSLAERLKFAKQNRSSANIPGPSGIKKENHILDKAENDDFNIKSTKEKKLSNELNLNTKPTSEKEENQTDMHVNDIPKVEEITREKEKPTAPVTNVIQNNQEIQEKNEHKEKIADKEMKSIVATSTESSHILEPHDRKRETKVANKAEPSKSESLSKKSTKSSDQQTNQIKEVKTSSINKSKEVGDGKSATDDTRGNVSFETSGVDKNLKFDSTKNLVEMNNSDGTAKISGTLKPDVTPDVDTSKTSSTVVENNISLEMKMINTQSEKQKATEATVEQAPHSGSTTGNVTPVLEVKDVKESSSNETASKIEITAAESVQDINKVVEQPKSEKYIPETSTEIPHTPNISEDENANLPDMSAIQKGDVKSENLPEEGNKSQEISEIMNTETNENTSKVTEPDRYGFEMISSDSCAERPSGIRNVSIESGTAPVEESNRKDTSITLSGPSEYQLNDLSLSASSAQNIPENQIKSKDDSPKSHLDSNKTILEVETALSESSEVSASDKNSTEQNINITKVEKVLTINEHIEKPPQTSVQEDEAEQRKDGDMASSQNVENDAGSSKDTTDTILNLNKADTIVTVPENNEESAVSSINEDTKSGKLKSAKTSKVKKSKSQEKDKKESKDKNLSKSEPSTNSTTSISSSPVNASENKISRSSDDASLNSDVAAPKEITDEQHEIKSLSAEKVLNEKETENKSKAATKTTESEIKATTIETNSESSEESKFQNSVAEKGLSPIESDSDVAFSIEQNVTATAESGSILPGKETEMQSTSKEDLKTAENRETGKESETQQIADSSKNQNEISSEIDDKTVPKEPELQAPVFSKEFPDNKNNVAADVPTTSKVADDFKSTEALKVNAPDNSKSMTVPSNENASDNSEAIALSSSSNASDIVKSEATSSSENATVISKSTEPTEVNVPDNSKTMAESSENIPVDLKATATSSKTHASDISKPVTTSSSENATDNSNTTEISKINDTDNSKPMPSSSSKNIPDNSKIIGTSSSTNASDIPKPGTSSSTNASDTSIPGTSSSENVDVNANATELSKINVPDNSKSIPPSSSENITDNSKTIETSSTKVSDIAKPAVASSSENTTDNSKPVASSSTNSLDSSNATASLSNANVPKETATSSSNIVPDNSKMMAASTSGVSKAVTDVKTLKDTTKDTEASSAHNENQQHSKVQGTVATDIPTSISNKISSPASTLSSSQNKTLPRSTSEEYSGSEATDSDYTDSEEVKPSSVTPPSPVDALRSRFEGLAAGTTVRGAPFRPASPFRRMSLNSRKKVIALEKKRDTAADKPWYKKKTLPEPVKLPQPKRTIKQQLEMERKVRQMVADRKCRTYRKAEIVVQLMDMNFDEEEAIQAAHECSTLEQAISYLQQECLLCTGHFPVSQIVSMTHCEHRACRECIRAYFTVQIRDRTILDLLCPFCNEPDIGDEDVAQDYFNHLDIMLKKLVDIEIHELFQRKLRDRVLMKDPNFRWCSQCSSGFIAMPNLKRLICPDCNAVTCASCRRLWEREHQGISCEAFAALKDASDPEAQAAGLAKLLTEDGIDCPSCHFRYALAKGGCMHFRCIQCQHDFCSGCSRPFKMGQKCGVSEFCAKLGLHAHHPRNCLFYLRDKEPEDLQKLLDMNDIKYNREPLEGMELQSRCQVMEQKETADGMVDDYCGKEVQDGYAGLCRLHYVEYLGQLVNKHKVDPIQIFDSGDLELVLKRANIRLPPKRYRESDLSYREKLVNIIEEELPLDKVDGS